MLLSVELLRDFLSTIALMGPLAVGYGTVMRAFTREAVAQTVLGALFGAAAIVAMLDPLHVTDGVIVDLRSVPVTLAGAFLGVPGAIVTTLMALAMRMGLGGTGMVSGSLGIILSALIGLGWAAFARRPGHTLRNALLLAALSQLTMVTYLLLPWEVTWKAMTTVWPTLVPLRFVGVLVLAALIRREQVMGSQTKQLGLEAGHDPLTGLLNRRGFEAAMRHVSPRELGCAFLVLDLDHFKRVNDTHGHVAGDAVLQGVATRLSHALRPNDVVARFGGEEMIVFLPGLTARAAMDVATRLCRVVRDRPVTLSNGENVAVTTSVGGVWTDATINQVKLEDLLGQADAALYAAKEAGRDCWRFAAGERMTGSPAEVPPVALRLVA